MTSLSDRTRSDAVLWRLLHSLRFLGSLSQQTNRATRNSSSTGCPKSYFLQSVKRELVLLEVSTFKLSLFIQKSKDSSKELLKLLPPRFPMNKRFNAFDSGSLLLATVRGQLWKCSKLLILQFKADYNLTDDDSCTPLIEAAWQGNLRFVQFLLTLPDIDTTCKGRPLKTSVCGGKDHFTAAEWALRKSTFYPESKSFLKIANLLSLEA